MNVLVCTVVGTPAMNTQGHFAGVWQKGWTSLNPSGSRPAVTWALIGPTPLGPRAIVVPSVANVVKSEPTKPGPRRPEPSVGRGVGFSVNTAVLVTPPAETEIVTGVGAVTAEVWVTKNDATGFSGSEKFVTWTDAGTAATFG